MKKYSSLRLFYLFQKIRFAKILLIVISFLFFQRLNAQEIFGQIELKDSENNKSKVLITVKPINLSFFSDENGFYKSPKLLNDTLIFEFALIGYKKETFKIFLNKDQKQNLNLVLTPIPFLLNEFVVTGTLKPHLLKDSPIITEVLDKNIIENFNLQSLSEILPLQTGIDLTQSIGQTQNIRLQGLKKNQVLILIDGERTSGKVDDAIDISQIPISYIEKIEIVKGPLSSIYGSEAIGGVINILTKKTSNELNYNATTSYGNFNRFDFNFNLTNGFNVFDNLNYSFLINSSYNSYDGVDYNKNDFTTELPSFNKKNVSLKNEFNYKNKFFINFKNELFLENNSWLAGGSKWVYFIDESDNKKFSSNINSKLLINDNSFINLAINNSKFDHISSEKTNSNFIVRNQKSVEEISTLRLNSQFSPYKSSFITIGFEKNNEEIFSDRILSKSKSISTDVFYFEDEWSLNPVVVNFGGRFSNNSNFGKFFAPRLSVLYNSTPNLIFRSSYGKGFRAPSLNELFINFNHSSVGYEIVGNPNLQPENSTGINFGFDYSRDDLVWFRLNIYKNHVYNLIEYFNKPDSGNSIVMSYHNINQTNIIGADLDINLNPNDNFKIDFGYNFISNTNENEPLLFQSPNSASFKVNYIFDDIKTSIFFLTKWVDIKNISDEQYNVSNYQNGGIRKFKTIPSHFVLNASIANQSINNYKFAFGINNILDVKHYPFGQSKPREMYITISYSNN